jgi:tRNA-dihydrouridine synthase
MGARVGLRHARKHLSAYAEYAGASDALRLRLVTTDDPSQARELLREAFESLSDTSLSAEAA